MERRTANRNPKEIWANAPKNVIIKNPAFEIACSEHIKGIVSEYGVLNFRDFVKRELERHKRL